MNRRDVLKGAVAAALATVLPPGTRFASGGVVTGHVGYFVGDRHFGETLIAPKKYREIIGRSVVQSVRGRIVVINGGDRLNGGTNGQAKEV